MRRFVLFFAVVFAAHAAVPALMPLPAKLEWSSGGLAIDGKFTVSAAGVPDPRLDAALTRFIGRVARQTGIIITAQKPVVGPGKLRVECAARGPEIPALGENEAYTLDVTPDGAHIKAATVVAALRGLETFAQLIGPGADGFSAPAVHIEDRPRFAWRGLLLDVSRHWMPVEVVERNLEAMAAVKLNVLHWHLSDDQGFRVESKRYPHLQERGSDGLFYTQADIRRVVAFARNRGIRIVPEFDVPGHTAAWMPGYPELASAKGPYEIGRTFGVNYSTMDPSSEWTYTFLDGFFGEMATLFPDAYFHIGGDEVNPTQWKASARIQAFNKLHHLKDAHDLQAYFNKRILKILQKHGKIMIGWDEILHPDLPKATVVQVWRDQKDLAIAATQGYRSILSANYYLDHLRTAKFHYANDPLGGGAAQLKPEEAARILGGEACMWAELVSSETVDSRIWPRLAAIAERLWSPQDVTDPESMYTRLEVISRELEWTGVQHRANYGPMLDRLADGRLAEPLRILADASEALGLGTGRSANPRVITTQTPLNRLVDAARPESESVRALEQVATRVAGGRPADTDIATLSVQFRRWETNDPRFQALADGNGMLTELKTLSQDLSALGKAGLRLLDGYSGSAAPPADWMAAEPAEIARMLKANADVRLAAARVIKILLDGAQKRAPRP